MVGQLNLFDMLDAQNAEKVVRRITYEETKPFLLKIHYARRMPCVTDAFGLFVNGELVGVVTYGVPASRPLCIGLAGVENEWNFCGFLRRHSVDSCRLYLSSV